MFTRARIGFGGGWPTIALLVLLVVVAAWAGASCYADRIESERERQALEAQERALEAFHDANRRRAMFHAAAKAREDSLKLEAATAIARADRETRRRRELEAEARAALPDTGRAREAFEEFAASCGAEVSEFRQALGLCEAGRLSAEARADSLEVELGEAVALADSTTVGWRRSFDRRHGLEVSCGPGAAITLHDAGLAVSCHVPLVRIRLQPPWRWF